MAGLQSIIDLKGHLIRLTDVISIQPGNWITNWVVDFFIESAYPDNDSFSCMNTVIWEVITKNNKLQMEKYRKLNLVNMEKPLIIFPIVEGGHWLVAVVLKKLNLKYLDSLKRDQSNYKQYTEKINRFLQTDISQFQIVPVQQQENGDDCGPITIHHISELFRVLSDSTNIDEAFGCFSTFVMENPNKIRREMKERILSYQV